MKKLGFIAALTASMGLSACGSAPIENPTRNAPPALHTQAMAASQTPQAQTQAQTQTKTQAQITAPPHSSFRVEQVQVRVPKSLTVSEANRFYPGGDIVWREDPPGDRHAQVKAIVKAAMLKGVKPVEPGQVPVLLDIKVTRFHALTEKARYTVGGVHAVQFEMMLVDPTTGTPLSEPKFVKADFKALGGQAAVRAEQAGQTQKVRITDHLAKVIREELTQPGGYAAANLGLMGALNQL